jgi:type VI secretion system protein VasJ
MLGKVKPKAGWIWYADGKHPAAKDFLKIGPREPLLQALIDWAAAGFQQMSAGRKPAFANNSWRFWTGGNRRSHIICGVMRDSCDSFGRSFPLTVLGTGPLKDWEAHWELLPLVLDKPWQRIEYLATKRRLDFNQLENEVRMLPFPTNNWSELSLAGQQASDHNAGSCDDSAAAETQLQNRISVQSDPLVSIMPLINVSQNNQPRQLSWLYAILKKRSRKVPNAVFMGGSPTKNYLMVFNRPIGQSDFSRLWTQCA